MSLILDALRKLDREKSSRRAGIANIAAEILKPDLPHSGKGILRSFTAVCLAVVATAAITYALVGQGLFSKSSPPVSVNPPVPSEQQGNAAAPKPKSLPATGVNPPAPSPQVTPVAPGSKSLPLTAVNPPAPSPEAASPSVAHGPAHESRSEISPAAPKIQDPAGNRKPISAGGEKPSQNAGLKEAEISPGNAEKSAGPTPHGSATNPPELKLTGVAWHEEPAQRRAMINGRIVTEGTEIEGVRVMEIQPARVLLSYDGRPFEISIQ